VFTEVFPAVPVTLLAGPVPDVTELPVGAPPLGLKDCAEHPATNHGPATESINTDGKNDFIRVPGGTHARLYAS
jgi:hypothetical protein